MLATPAWERYNAHRIKHYGSSQALTRCQVLTTFTVRPGYYWSRTTSVFSLRNIWYTVYTENVCHHITTLDHPPREMKETLFTRHNQTVLANTKKASLQAVHTSIVNTAIDNMTDNRVLNYRPPPISDEESYLTRRQRATLSQLRSGHCTLLNSYKKRLKQTDSSSCPDCGMDRRMFLACSTAPLTPPL